MLTCRYAYLLVMVLFFIIICAVYIFLRNALMRVDMERVIVLVATCQSEPRPNAPTRLSRCQRSTGDTCDFCMGCNVPYTPPMAPWSPQKAHTARSKGSVTPG